MQSLWIGSQWNVPRIGYEIKDWNSGRVLCKDVKLMEGITMEVPRKGYGIKDRNSGRVLCKDVKLMD
jgi:hypothetical protein